jgi:hypothetical protein
VKAAHVIALAGLVLTLQLVALEKLLAIEGRLSKLEARAELTRYSRQP